MTISAKVFNTTTVMTTTSLILNTFNVTVFANHGLPNYTFENTAKFVILAKKDEWTNGRSKLQKLIDKIMYQVKVSFKPDTQHSGMGILKQKNQTSILYFNSIFH